MEKSRGFSQEPNHLKDRLSPERADPLDSIQIHGASYRRPSESAREVESQEYSNCPLPNCRLPTDECVDETRGQAADHHWPRVVK